MSDNSFRVSDHALIRWLERRHGFDMDFFRRKIAEEVGTRHVAGTKQTTINGLTYRFDGQGTLITVIRKGTLTYDQVTNVVPFVFPCERRSA